MAQEGFWAGVGTVLRWFVYLPVVFLAFTLLALIVTHIGLAVSADSLLFLKWWPDLLLAALGTDTSKLLDGQYQAIVADVLLLIALVLTTAPLVARQRLEKLRTRERETHQKALGLLRKQVSEDIGITVTPLSEENEFEWMLKHYREAERIDVFAGSFDWLPEHEGLLELIISKAKEGRITFYSYRTEAKVRAKLMKVPVGGGHSLFRVLREHFRFGKTSPICNDEAGECW